MSFWKNRAVFVTGATGLLGSWLVEELLSRSAFVTCLLRDWVPNSKLLVSDLLSRTNVVRGDLDDYNTLLRALNEYEIDTVFHLGAQTIVGTAARSAISTFESNIRGTWNLLEACRTCAKKIERVVVASSDKAYGPSDRLPYTEESPLQGRFPYDVSKSCGDLICFAYWHTYAVPLAVTRSGNIFGGGDLNFNRLVPGTIRSALENQPPIIRSNGKLIREYFFVRDAVSAYLKLAEQLPGEKVVGQAFNLGNETPLSVIDLVSKILELTNKSFLQPKILNEATHEIENQSLNCSKAREVLGWKAQHTLEEGLVETISWYQEWFKKH